MMLYMQIMKRESGNSHLLWYFRSVNVAAIGLSGLGIHVVAGMCEWVAERSVRLSLGELTRV